MPATATRWTRLREGLSHAFAVRGEPLTEEQLALIDRLADEVKRRRMTPVVALGAELARPVAGVTAHSVTFFEPFLSAFVAAGKIEAARRLLQHPDAEKSKMKKIKLKGKEAKKKRQSQRQEQIKQYKNMLKFDMVTLFAGDFYNNKTSLLICNCK
eukprot:TRINITY_DN7887_c0_g3_i1.p3 TRINITY_DN7887_c0_g3~~TRINITY_DN7887_c0_g3_i1.p3  ORF type:complete len:156 (-),score=12.86 TRINITY_DN7887_c0_g3_i1:16-483(-)